MEIKAINIKQKDYDNEEDFFLSCPVKLTDMFGLSLFTSWAGASVNKSFGLE